MRNQPAPRRALLSAASLLLSAFVAAPDPAQAAAAAGTADEAELRRLVLEDYRALWTKRDGRFSIEPADRLYADTPDLTAIDTDLGAIRLTPDQGTRMRGYGAYRAIWPAIFERVGGFEQEIRNLEVRVMGAAAVTTFDGVGVFTGLDGARTPTRKNFTLVWERRPEGWRIVHEHISDGR